MADTISTGDALARLDAMEHQRALSKLDAMEQANAQPQEVPATQSQESPQDMAAPSVTDAGPPISPSPKQLIPAASQTYDQMLASSRMSKVLSSVGTPAPSDRSLSLPEKILEPAMNVASMVGRAIQRGTADTSSPEARKILGEQPGSPLDTETGAAFMDRLASQFTFNRAEQEYALRSNPNVQDVRFNSLGEPIISLKDKQTGKVKDILVNPVGLDPGDFAFALANLPQMFAGGKAAVGVKGLQSASKLAQWFLASKNIAPSALRGAVVGETVGALTDISGRTEMASKNQLPPADIVSGEGLAQRGKGVLADYLFGHAMGVAAGGLSRVITPVSQRGPIQMNAEAAAKMWEQQGVHFEMTPGEATGAPILQRSEAYATAKPGSSGVFNEMKAGQRAAVDQMQTILIGSNPSAVPAADLVGERALTAIGDKLRPIDSVIDRTTQQILDTASKEIQSGVSTATGIPNNVVTTSVGSQLFKKAADLYDAFQAQNKALYQKVTQDPRILAQGRNIDATPLAQDAQGLLQNVASVEKQVEVPALDAYGSPTATTKTVTEPITAVLNPNTMAILKQLASAKGGKIGYSDLIEARTDIGEALGRGAILGGIGEKRLGSIYATMTRQIQTGLDSLDSTGGLRASWEAANAHHADNIAKFHDVDILPIFKDPDKHGALGLTEVVTRALSDPDRWSSYRDFFGTSSPEMGMMRRAYADKIVGRVIGSDTVDGGAFLSRLQTAYQSQAGTVDDVFGSKLTDLNKLGEVAKQAATGQVDANELAKALSTGTLTRAKLKELALAQAVKQDTYRNALFVDMAKGNFDANPSQVVDSVVFAKNSEPHDVAGLVGLISDQPDILKEIKQRTVLKIIDESTGGPVGKETLTSTGLDRFLLDATMRDRLRHVLGNDTLKMLDQTRDLLKPGEMKERAFGAAGSISQGNIIGKIERDLLNVIHPTSMIGDLWGIIKSWLTARLYDFGPTRAWISNNALGSSGTIADRAAFINAFVATAPAVKDLLHILGSEAGRVASIQLKAAIDGDLRTGQNKQSISREEALKRLDEMQQQRKP